MDIKQNIDRYIYHPKVREFYELYRSTSKNGYPSLNYFGINFNSAGIASFKFYCAFFNKLQEKEILQFLPQSNDFLKYYHLWQPSFVRNLEHTGCTFELKFKPDMQPIYGFHYRVMPTKEAYDLIGYPEQLPFEVSEIEHAPGINYEYSDDLIVRKKYYYFTAPAHKQYIADRFKIPFAAKAELLEYTEADAFAKVNVWRFDHAKENLQRPGAFNEYATAIIAYLKNSYRLINISDGYYEHSDIWATYFFNTVNSSKAPFSDIENSSIDTLKLFYP